VHYAHAGVKILFEEGSRMKAITKRFCKVLEVVYGGNTSQMAHDIGVDRSTCSRYKDGKTIPNRRSLMALSHEKGISLDWLERGLDEEIQYEQQSSSSDGISEWGLKVFRSPVVAVVEESQLGETGMLIATPSSFYDPKRYWLEVRQEFGDHAIRIGDLLLIQPCDARDPAESDVNRLRTVMHAGDLTPVLAIVTNADPKNKGKQKIVGAALLLHRDLQG
jgi:transcriptional regulator with XRE-family HTH domain